MTPHEAYDKCYDEGKRIPELENVIATNSYYSYRYARNIIKGKFIEGEKIISTDLKYSYWYAKDVLKGRFEEGEKIITTDPYSSYYYAKEIIKSPFHLGHPVIFNSKYRDDYLDFLKHINCDFKEIYEQYGEWLI
jgi:hypothetical protein